MTTKTTTDTVPLGEGEKPPLPEIGDGENVVTHRLVTAKVVKPRAELGPITSLRFTPYAWAKLHFMRDAVSTEISGMGIAGTDDPLLITDIAIIRQQCSVAHTEFDPEDYADFVMDMCDPDGEYKLPPAHVMRVWIHTHPGNMNVPSPTDEGTFKESFGEADWAVMAILARGGGTYARLRTTVGGFSTAQKIDMCVAWDSEFPGSQQEDWFEEIRDKVSESVRLTSPVMDSGRTRGVKGMLIPNAAAQRQSTYSSYSHGRSYANANGYDDWLDDVPSSFGQRTSASGQATGSRVTTGSSTMTVHPRISIPDYRYVAKQFSSYVLQQIAFKKLRHEQMTYAIREQLRRVSSIRVLSTPTKEGYVSILLLEGEFGGKISNPEETPLTTADICFIGGQPYETQDKTGAIYTMDKKYEGELRDAEDILYEIAKDRITETGKLLKNEDVFGNLITCVFPWRCLDGCCMWVSEEEQEKLVDVADGKESSDIFDTADEAEEEGEKDCPFCSNGQLPDGSFCQECFGTGIVIDEYSPSDNTDVDSGAETKEIEYEAIIEGESPEDEVYNDVLSTLVEAELSSMSSNETKRLLGMQTGLAADDTQRLRYRVMIAMAEAVNFRPREFETQYEDGTYEKAFRLVCERLRSTGGGSDKDTPEGESAEKPVVNHDDPTDDIVKTVGDILQAMNMAGASEDEILASFALSAPEYEVKGLGILFTRATDFAAECGYDYHEFLKKAKTHLTDDTGATAHDSLKEINEALAKEESDKAKEGAP